MKQDTASKILSDITVHMKYARYLPKKERRETWKELVARNKKMHIKKYPHMKDEIDKVYKFVYDKKVLPSMRSLQFGGKPIEVTPNRNFNCAYLPIDDWRAFSETMFLLLGGSGVGFSVQRHHIEQLPAIQKPNSKRTRRYLVGDSIEGWADAVKALMKSYFHGGSKIRFDFSDIRVKGATLVTSGGKAPGPQPLKECLLKIEGVLTDKEDGTQLSTVEVHDIVCYIADAVLAGGVRRSALLSLFSVDDEDMLSAKTGTWWEKNPQRGRANNSIVLMRHRVLEGEFKKLWQRIKDSRAGEPGIYFTNDKDYGCNPCNEISLRPNQMCNLTEINASDIETQEEYEARAKAASFIGTLQAGYTDFHYLRDVWRRNTEKDSLLGVSMTGIASNRVLSLDMEAAAKVVKEENLRVSSLLGIKPAARLNCVKPSGTTSLVLGTSSGVHAWHSEYYVRRLRVGKNEAIYTYLAINHPELIEDEYFRPHDTAVISIPQKAPEGSITRTESALQFLRRVKDVHARWIVPGHVKGQNTHNVSATVTVKETEWQDVGDWMWVNRAHYNGLSILPADLGSYKQTPFEECSKEKYEALLSSLSLIDLTKIVELSDDTDLKGEQACGAGGCEVT